MSRLLRLAAVACVPLVLTAANIHVLATREYLRLAYAWPGFPAAPGFTDQSRLEAAWASTAFIVHTDPPAVPAALQHDGVPLYTAQEIAHLVDVRRLVAALTRLALAGLALTLAAVAWRLAAGDRGWVAEFAGEASLLTLVLVAVVAVGVLAAWRAVFVGFHEVLFPPGTWEFPEDSGLIRLFPEVFWQHAAIAIVTLTVAEALLLAWLGRLRWRRPGAAPG